MFSFSEYRCVRADVNEEQNENVVIFLIEKQQIVLYVALPNATIFAFQFVVVIARIQLFAALKDIDYPFQFNFIKILKLSRSFERFIVPVR